MKGTTVRTLLAVVAAFATVLDSGAATIAASSASQADVQTAYNASTSGDTVIIPSGTVSWSSSLIVTKNVSFIGAGVGRTVITGSGGRIFDYEPTGTNGVWVTGNGSLWDNAYSNLTIGGVPPYTNNQLQIDQGKESPDEDTLFEWIYHGYYQDQ